MRTPCAIYLFFIAMLSYIEVFYMTSAPSFIQLEVEPELHLSRVGSVMQRDGAQSPTAAQATRPVASRDR
jgi:hypothetical protein